MGSCCSAEPDRGQQQQNSPIQLQNISAPRGPRMVPKPERDESGQPIRHPHFDLTRYGLQQALGAAARYLSNRNRNITIVAVGGAVNTILLRSRDTTHDVDFIHADVQSSEMSLIDQAA